MPLPKTDLDLPFVAGLEQATSDAARDPSAGFTALADTVQRRRGAYTKRTGYSALPSSPGAPIALASHRDEALVSVDGQQVHAYSATAATWSTRGRIPSLQADRYGLAASGVFRGTVMYDVVQAGGLLVAVYETARGLYGAVYDADTKAPLRGPELLSVGLSGVDALQEFCATVVAVGSRVFCIYNRENQVAATREDAVYARMIDTANVSAGWGAPITLLGAGVIDLTLGTFVLDALGLTTRFALAYRDIGGAAVLATFDADGVILGATTMFFAAPGAMYSFGIGGVESDLIWCARVRASTDIVDVEARDPITRAIVGSILLSAFPTQLVESNSAGFTAGIVRTGPSRAKLVFSAAATSAGDYERHYVGWRELEVDGGAVVAVDAPSVAASLEATCKPFVAAGRTYVVAVPWDDFDAPLVSAPVELASATNRQRCCYVLDVTDARLGDVPPAANIAPRIVADRGMLYLPRYLRQMAGTSFLLLTLRSGAAEALELVELAPVTSCASAELGGLLHASGGALWAYDGAKSIECAFLQAPRVKFFTHVAVGLTGTYLYTAVWEHTDAAGNVHVSEPAPPVSVTAANQTPRMRITTPTVTLRDDRATGADRVRCVLYRTAAGGTTYYRCAEAPAYDAASGNGGTFIQFSDSMSDATLTQRARLYTQPGTLGTSLPRRAPPGLRGVVQHGDTLAGIADDRRTIWFSAPVVGGEGQWFSDLFVVEVNDTTPLVALASFDGRLFALTRSGVWVIDGQGFVENGGGGYGLPARIPVDVGCIDARSVVVTPQGALFLSDLGIAMLSRAGQVTFFGEAVGELTQSYPVCTSAVLESAENHVVFGLQSADGTSGVLLVYDYLSGAWTTESVRADAACMVQGVYHRSVGVALARRAEGTYLPWVGQVIETGWVKLGGMQGFQRLKRILLLYRTRTPAGLRVSIGYDYEDAYTDVRAWNETTLPASQLQIAPIRQRCQAFRVRVEELEPAPSELGTGQGLDFLGLRLVVAAKSRPGFAKTQRV